MADSILQNRDPRRRIAKPCQPRSGRRRLLGFGAQKNPIDAPRLCRVCKGAKSDLNVSLRPLEYQTFDWVPDAGDDVMLISRAQASRDDTPDASETNDRYSRAFPGRG
jgi:hypothetical protein